MSIYTTLPTAAADNVIAKELDFIVKHITESYGHLLQAILLVGGYGRGEGGIIREGNMYRPINDYDIIIVKKSIINKNGQDIFDISLLEKELEKEVSVKQVDLMVIEGWKLSIPIPSIARYEIRQGHKLLYGKLKFPICSFPAKYIPLHEGTKYFRTRASGLIIAKLILDGFGSFSPEKGREWAYIEINKALLAIGDSYLIQKGAYHYLYKARRDMVTRDPGQYGIPKEIAPAYLKAIDDKLMLNLEEIGQLDLEEEWKQACLLLINTFLQFESHRLKTIFSTMEQYSSHIHEQMLTPGLWTRIKNCLWCREDRIMPLRLRTIAILLLSASVNNEKWAIPIASRLLGARSSNFQLWEQLALDFLSQWHPAGVVSNLIADKL